MKENKGWSFNKKCEICNIFNNYFVNVNEELGIYKKGNIPVDCYYLADRIKCLSTIQTSEWVKENINRRFILTLSLFLPKYVKQLDGRKVLSGEISENIKIGKSKISAPITHYINPFPVNFLFLYPRKTFGFLTSSGGVEMGYWRLKG